MKTEAKTKGSSFRPSQNADGISENHHAGINRLVKLSLVVEGKIIKYYKHFTLKQKASCHHEFSLTIAHEAMHAMKLPHTFASVDETNLVRDYTYQATKTNNLMDYSHLANIERFCTYIWQ
ncbi:hypothetical protein QWZ06_20730 [Chryseobacterium tructae]|uniref:Uncharacterized protein n=1 Tax=Chryseobacterium tructae TaxID=1037380 RepID=A0ABV7Y0P6_9FLAO|nr:hypothetical protein [Chryseobacterium tructae]MDN3694516.1 hypothetical protein [Chryseobacterium tructae]